VKLEKFEYCAKVIIWMIMVYRQLMKTPNSKSQKIRILHEINNKKRILNTEMWAL